MKSFDYVRPASVADAITAASLPGSAYLAAGTNLIDLMKGGVSRPDRLVDVTRLPGLDRIEPLADGGVRIGALVRNADLAHDAAFAKTYPAVAEALLSGASAQLRNAATVGGNLLQRTRCAYFYDVAAACNRREPGSGCDARGGENRLHAVLGWSDACIATHPSDFCVPLVALNAVVEIEGKSGRREVRLEDLHRLPDQAPERETALEPGDLIVALSEGARTHLLRLRRRLRRGVSEHSARQDRGGTHCARRCRRQTLEGTRGRRAAGRGCARRRKLPARGGGGTRRGQAFWRQRIQDRARAAHRRARAGARRSG
jgi:xanthine dehydrogenase YagS FAD-binding subunit